MTFSLPRETRRLRSGASLLFLALALGSCVEGPSPTEFLAEGAPTALLSVAGDLTRSLVEEGAAPVNRIRVTATLVETGQTVGQAVVEVSPGDPSWTVDIEVDVPNIPNPQVVLTVELINVSGGVESVEWSGQTAPIALTATTSAVNAEVTVVRGPVENLSVTAVTIVAPEKIRAGKTAALDVTVVTSSTGDEAQVYWSSLTPHIGTVSETGIFTALAPGTAEVKATAGAATDTRSIQVLPALHQVVVDPGNVSIVALGVEVAFDAQVLDGNGDPVDGETVTWTVADETIMEPLGGGVFVSRGNGVTEITATSDSEPTLTASASVDVHQMPDRVEVTPAVDTLEAVGETTQYTAEVFDANDQPYPNAFLYWFTGDEGVATVDETGLVTAQGGGETNVNAEVILLLAAPPAGQPAAPVEGGTGVVGTAKVVVDLPMTLSLTPTNANLPSIGATVQMVATVEAGAGNKVTGLTYAWASSDPGVATVDANGVVTAVMDGQTTITVSTGGMNATAVVTVKQEVAAVQWVQQPTDGESDWPFDPPVSVEVVDANGHRVVNFEGEAMLEAQWVGYGYSPPAEASAGQTGPERTVYYSPAPFQQGLAVFVGAYMTGAYGYFQLTAWVLTLYVVSDVFFMYYGY